MMTTSLQCAAAIGQKLASLFNENTSSLINIGCGEDLAICELLELAREVVGFESELIINATKPDGTRRKALKVSKIRILSGWQAKTPLTDGITYAYENFLELSNRFNANPPTNHSTIKSSMGPYRPSPS